MGRCANWCGSSTARYCKRVKCNWEANSDNEGKISADGGPQEIFDQGYDLETDQGWRGSWGSFSEILTNFFSPCCWLLILSSLENHHLEYHQRTPWWIWEECASCRQPSHLSRPSDHYWLCWLAPVSDKMQVLDFVYPKNKNTNRKLFLKCHKSFITVESFTFGVSTQGLRRVALTG